MQTVHLLCKIPFKLVFLALNVLLSGEDENIGVYTYICACLCLEPSRAKPNRSTEYLRFEIFICKSNSTRKKSADKNVATEKRHSFWSYKCVDVLVVLRWRQFFGQNTLSIESFFVVYLLSVLACSLVSCFFYIFINAQPHVNRDRKAAQLINNSTDDDDDNDKDGDDDKVSFSLRFEIQTQQFI